MRKYLVWKDKNCNGVDPEWIEMTGNEFYRFMSKPENAGRRFIVLDDRFCEGADVIIIEATEEEYQKWRKEHDHERYLDKMEQEREIVSLYDAISLHDGLTYEDVIADEDVDVESTVIQETTGEIYKKVMGKLDKQERKWLQILLIKNRHLTDSQIAEKYGFARSTIIEKKQMIRNRMRELLAKNDMGYRS